MYLVYTVSVLILLLPFYTSLRKLPMAHELHSELVFFWYPLLKI